MLQHTNMEGNNGFSSIADLQRDYKLLESILIRLENETQTQLQQKENQINQQTREIGHLNDVLMESRVEVERLNEALCQRDGVPPQYKTQVDYLLKQNKELMAQADQWYAVAVSKNPLGMELKSAKEVIDRYKIQKISPSDEKKLKELRN